MSNPLKDYLTQPAFPPISKTRARFCVFGGLAGILLSLSFAHRQENAHLHFIRTDAKVISSSIGHSHGGGHRPERNYGARIRYAYNVNGHDYKSDVYELDEATADFYSRKEAENFAASYASGKTVSAWYNPDKPSQAVLYNPKPTEDTNSLPYTLQLIVLCSLLIIRGCVNVTKQNENVPQL